MTTLPPSLVRFQSELVDAISSSTRARRRRSVAYRIGTVAVAAACVVAMLATANVVTDRAPSVVDRATAALTASGDTILHIHLRGERTGDGTTTAWESEGWRTTSEPFHERQLEIFAAGHVEWAFEGALHQVYDARSNTIYEVTKQDLAAALGARPEQGKPAPSKEAVAANARAAAGKPGADSATQPSAKRAQTYEEKFRDAVIAMLDSGEARVEGHVAVDGRDAIRIVSTGKQSTYIVDAATYNPIEWRTVEVDGGTTTLRFLAYEQLPATDANRALVSLAAQHPTATVSHDASAAAAALRARTGRP